MKVEKILNEKEQTSQIQGLSKMKVVRTAVYARVSTDMDIQKSSLEEQMKSFRAKIDEHPGWVLVDVYADEGISGTRVKHRKAFLRMIKAYDWRVSPRQAQQCNRTCFSGITHARRH